MTPNYHGNGACSRLPARSRFCCLLLMQHKRTQEGPSGLAAERATRMAEGFLLRPQSENKSKQTQTDPSICHQTPTQEKKKKEIKDSFRNF